MHNKRMPRTSLRLPSEAIHRIDYEANGQVWTVVGRMARADGTMTRLRIGSALVIRRGPRQPRLIRKQVRESPVSESALKSIASFINGRGLLEGHGHASGSTC